MDEAPAKETKKERDRRRTKKEECIWEEMVTNNVRDFKEVKKDDNQEKATLGMAVKHSLLILQTAVYDE